MVWFVVALVLAPRPSFWSDEGDTWATSATKASYFWSAIRGWDAHAPLYFALERGASAIGDGHLAMRLVSIAAGVLTIHGLFALGVRTSGRAVGFAAAALGAASPTALHFGLDARSYAVTIALVTWSSVALLDALATESAPRWGLYALLASAVVCSHVLAAAAIVGHGVLVLVDVLRRRRRPSWAEIGAGAAIGAVGAALYVLSREATSSKPIALGPTPKGIAVGLRDLVGYASYPAAIPLLLLMAGGALVAARAVRRGPVRTLAPTLFVGIPFLVLLAASFAKPLMSAQYLTPALPGALVLAATGFDALRREKASFGAVALAVALTGSAIGEVHVARTLETEDFQGGMAAVVRDAQPGDRLVYFDAYSAWVGAYYLRHARARPALLLPDRGFPAPLRLDEPVVPPDEIRLAAAAPGRIWLVVRTSEELASPADLGDVVAALQPGRSLRTVVWTGRGVRVERFEP